MDETVSLALEETFEFGLVVDFFRSLNLVRDRQRGKTRFNAQRDPLFDQLASAVY
jgi:hypothetical protein